VPHDVKRELFTLPGHLSSPRFLEGFCSVLDISVVNISRIIMLSVNFFCNISSYDMLAYITKNYIALIYYAKIVHILSMPVSRGEG
jgi:hypothetical protein